MNHKRYRKGDILTICDRNITNKDILVIVEECREVSQSRKIAYHLRLLNMGHPSKLIWSEKEIDAHVKLVVPASELASILYE